MSSSLNEAEVRIVACPSVELSGAGRPLEVPMEHREFDYDAFIKPVESRMMRSIWRIVRHKEAAEDALQDALAVIWRKRRAVARHPNPQALILRIAVSAAVDAVRKTQRRLRHEIPAMPGRLAEGAASGIVHVAQDSALQTLVLEAIGRLPRRQATAVLLRVVGEQSYEEIARGLGCSDTTARIHVMRGRAALARSLAHLKPGYIRGRRASEEGGVS